LTAENLLRTATLAPPDIRPHATSADNNKGEYPRLGDVTGPTPHLANEFNSSNIHQRTVDRSKHNKRRISQRLANHRSDVVKRTKLRKQRDVNTIIVWTDQYGGVVRGARFKVLDEAGDLMVSEAQVTF